MTLAEYLAEHGLTHSAFAERIGTTQTAVTRYASGRRVPRPRQMRRIIIETGGAVSANDFYGVPVREKEFAA
jgi:predicted transcriptional regulator